jgi:hypothetical protein
MRLVAHRFLVAFLSAWLPFCCCQVRGAAQAVVHLSHETETAQGDDCCSRGAAKDACCDGDADEGACCDSAAGEDSSDRAPATKGNCCIACKVRALPPVAPDSVDLVASATVDFVATALLPSPDAGAHASSPSSACPDATGPPPRPAGRDALSAHSILVI